MSGRVILYDCRDVGRGATMRVFDPEDRFVMQGQVFERPESFARILAGLLEYEYRYVGPAASDDLAGTAKTCSGLQKTEYTVPSTPDSEPLREPKAAGFLF